jgi:uncharacterized RDD family membrane protein YckC
MATVWYYAANNRQVGPVSEAELDALAASGGIGMDTLVWSEGMANWSAYGAVRPHAAAPERLAAPPLAPTTWGSAAAPATAPDEPRGAMRFCTECGRQTPERELVTFGDRVVCANCKPAFTHGLRERGLSAGQYVYAGFWIRFLARVIDGFLVNIVVFPLMFMVMGASMFGDPNAAVASGAFLALQVVMMFFGLAVQAAYEVFFLTRYAATPGKMVVGKKVVAVNGATLTAGRAFARYLATILSSFTLMIGYIIAAFDDEKRALHDRICDTRVVAK